MSGIILSGVIFTIVGVACVIKGIEDLKSPDNSL